MHPVLHRSCLPNFNTNNYSHQCFFFRSRQASIRLEISRVSKQTKKFYFRYYRLSGTMSRSYRLSRTLSMSHNLSRTLSRSYNSSGQCPGHTICQGHCPSHTAHQGQCPGHTIILLLISPVSAVVRKNNVGATSINILLRSRFVWKEHFPPIFQCQKELCLCHPIPRLIPLVGLKEQVLHGVLCPLADLVTGNLNILVTSSFNDCLGSCPHFWVFVIS